MGDSIIITKKTTNNELFNTLRWVLKARYKITVYNRYATENIKVTQDSVVAIDPHRLHIAHCNPLNISEAFIPGLWKVLVDSASKIVLLRCEPGEKFPEYEQIFPFYNEYFTVDADKYQLERVLAGFVLHGFCLDIESVKDALLNDMCEFACPANKNAPIRISNCDNSLQAYIMPYEFNLNDKIKYVKYHDKEK